MSDFYKHFKENMDGLNLPTPENLFGTTQTALATTTALLGAIDKFGKKVTLRELAGAGTKLEQLAMLGALSASFYAGAVIGSITVATGRTLAGGTSIADVLLDAQRNHLHRPWLPSLLVRHPRIYSQKPARRRPRTSARVFK